MSKKKRTRPSEIKPTALQVAKYLLKQKGYIYGGLRELSAVLYMLQAVYLAHYGRNLFVGKFRSGATTPICLPVWDYFKNSGGVLPIGGFAEKEIAAIESIDLPVKYLVFIQEEMTEYTTQRKEYIDSWVDEYGDKTPVPLIIDSFLSAALKQNYGALYSSEAKGPILSARNILERFYSARSLPILRVMRKTLLELKDTPPGEFYKDKAESLLDYVRYLPEEK